MTSHVVAGVLLDADDARFLAQVLDATGPVLARGGAKLPPRAVALARFLADASADADASAPVPADPGLVSLIPDADPFVDSATAAAHLGCTTSNIRDLLRRGRLQGVRHNGRWLVDATSLHEYTNRSSDGKR
ncbi:helix-turn-helix domain-containing protein [Rhodococcus sp. NPDC060086]|uniref:helix-turn-helix domain-containing protein n=1 Tax=Rhodococcus sp. NPDC060086 TaxID=3347055 RepID=UPI00365F9B69